MKKLSVFLSMAALGLGVLTGCGSVDQTTAVNDSVQAENADASQKTEAATEDVQEELKESSGEVTVVKAATSGGPAPYITVNDDGSLTGYDVEVINELFDRLDEYDVEWEITEFASIFTGLDSDLYQIGVNHLGFNTDRAQKYIYSDVMAIDPVAILVSKDNTDINSVYDLPGHSTEATATSYYLSVFDNFNATNPDTPINYSFIEDAGQMPLHVSDGTVDFEIFTKTTLQAQVESLGLDDVKFIDVSTEDNEWLTSGVDTPSGTFYLVAKGNEDLSNKLNEVFEEVVEDGTIFELQKKYLGVTEDNKLTLEQVKNTKELIQQLIENAGE